MSLFSSVSSSSSSLAKGIAMTSKRKPVRCPLCEERIASKPEFLAIRQKRQKLLEARNQRYEKANQVQLDLFKSDQMQLNLFLSWKLRNVLNKVMAQGSCACCWAIGATRCTDAVHKLTKKSKILIELSPQDLVNCITPLPFDKMEFVDEETRKQEIEKGKKNLGFLYNLPGAYLHMREKGVRFASAVPFVGERTETSPPKRPEKFLKLRDFVLIPYNEEALFDAVSSHPVAVALKMSKKSMHLFQKHKRTDEIFYGARHDKGKGVSQDDDDITAEESKARRYVGHVVLLVGYLTIGKVDCWHIMNSYGEKWGVDGFGYIPRPSSMPSDCDLKISPAFCPVV